MSPDLGSRTQVTLATYPALSGHKFQPGLRLPTQSYIIAVPTLTARTKGPGLGSSPTNVSNSILGGRPRIVSPFGAALVNGVQL